jgi:hypothetical protein
MRVMGQADSDTEHPSATSAPNAERIYAAAKDHLAGWKQDQAPPDCVAQIVGGGEAAGGTAFVVKEQAGVNAEAALWKPDHEDEQ